MSIMFRMTSICSVQNNKILSDARKRLQDEVMVAERRAEEAESREREALRRIAALEDRLRFALTLCFTCAYEW